jgi:DNA-directed RNA polymerase omega subunit
MNYVTADELQGKSSNKYEAVVVAALRARELNALMKKQRPVVVEDGDEAEEELQEVVAAVKVEGDVREKVTVIALAELIEGKIKFKRGKV